MDVEPDCPPYLRGYRGIEEGMPRLLEMLGDERIAATFFTTGDVALRYPALMNEIVARGHELACHGMTHRPFTSMTHAEARTEITESATILRRHGEVTSFRAPYLRFPEEYVGLLRDNGFVVDSSGARYKRSGERGVKSEKGLRRIPASVTSSVLRLPRVVRELYLRAMGSPLVLFVHPWELVDLRRERLRLDCRFRTGDTALACIRDVLQTLKRRGARFVTMRELSAMTAA